MNKLNQNKLILLHFLFFTFFTVNLLSAQVILYENKSNLCGYEKNILFNNQPNDLVILVEGIKCQKLSITVDSGVVCSKDCIFTIHPKVKNISWEFPVYLKYKDKCDTLFFLVISPPTPQFDINGISGLHFRHINYTYFDFLRVSQYCGNQKPIIDSFIINVKNDSILLFQFKINGHIISDSVRSAIKANIAEHLIVEVEKVFFL